jgi:hypothetical protein
MADSEFFTPTLAAVYAQQGHFDKSADIYRHILAREPNREDIQIALADVERRLQRQPSVELSDLFHIWFDLIRRHKRLKKLAAFRQNLNSRD